MVKSTMRKYILFVFCFVIFVGCQRAKNNKNNIVETLSDKEIILRCEKIVKDIEDVDLNADWSITNKSNLFPNLVIYGYDDHYPNYYVIESLENRVLYFTPQTMTRLLKNYSIKCNSLNKAKEIFDEYLLFQYPSLRVYNIVMNIQQTGKSYKAECTFSQTVPWSSPKNKMTMGSKVIHYNKTLLIDRKGIFHVSNAQESKSKYKVIGKWGKPVNGLRCRLSIGKSSYKPTDKIEFLLELQNISDKPINIHLEQRDWFGSIGCGANKLVWSPPIGKFKNAYRVLKPKEVIYNNEFVPIHNVPLPENKYHFIGSYSNTIKVSDESFYDWSGKPVTLWTEEVSSEPVVISIEKDVK